MKISLRLLPFVALVALFSLTARAQVTYTTTGVALNTAATASNYSYGQTFTGVTDISDVSWMMQNVGGTISSSADFKLYLMDWTNPSATPVDSSHVITLSNVATNDSALLSFSSFSVGGLDPASTYALVVTMVSGDSGFQHLYADPANNDGAFFSSGNMVSFLTSAYTLGNDAAYEATIGDSANSIGMTSYDMGMNITATMAPVPEPKTAAAGIAALFIAGLVGRQLWLRRKAAPTPVQAAV